MRRTVILASFLLLAMTLVLVGCASPAPTATSAPPAGAPTIAPAATSAPNVNPTVVGPTMELGTPAPNNGPSGAPTAAPTTAQAAPTTSVSTTPSPAPTTSGATAASCDHATFVADVTVRDRTAVAPGQTFNKIWRMRNTGTCTWGSGYDLVLVRGVSMSKENVIPVPTTAPGATVDLLVPMIAPSNTGIQTSFWRLRSPSGTLFGSVVWVTVNILKGSTPAAAQPTASPTP